MSKIEIQVLTDNRRYVLQCGRRRKIDEKLLVACLLVGSLVCCFVVLEKKKNKTEL